uniref:Uncharacterized protein n=1 Tax=Caenorhabditis tropicalis TaxID=1561998 RepID=A0A1I7TSP3_9PELO
MTMNKENRLKKRLRLTLLPRIKDRKSVVNRQGTPFKPKKSLQKRKTETKAENKENKENIESKFYHNNVQSTSSISSNCSKSVESKIKNQRITSPFSSSRKKRKFLIEELFEHNMRPSLRKEKPTSLADLHKFDVIIELKEEHRLTPPEYYQYP